MSFPEYNGWSNKATCSVFTIFTSSEETRVPLERQAQKGTEQVQSFVEVVVHSWREGSVSYGHSEAPHRLGREFIQFAIRSVGWCYIYYALRGERVPEPANELTRIVYELLSTQDWQDIVGNARDEIAAADMLSNWFERLSITWAGIPDDRKLHGPISKFTLVAIDIYMKAVNWHEITEALRGEVKR